MSAKIWTSDDLNEVSNLYPGLSVCNGEVVGKLPFMASLNGERCLVIDDISYDAPIVDEYLIKIVGYDVYDCSNRIKGRVNQRGVSLADFHMYDSGKMCLCDPYYIYEADKHNITLGTFIARFIIPFLYAQEYYWKFNVWPWGELRHGYLGLLGEYAVNAHHNKDRFFFLFKQLKYICGDSYDGIVEALLNSKNGSNRYCPVCDSGAKMRNCCYSSVINAVLMLRSERQGFHITLSDIHNIV